MHCVTFGKRVLVAQVCIRPFVQVLKLTEQLKAQPEGAQESLSLVEKYISEAYQIIDKSAKVREIYQSETVTDSVDC